MIPLSASRWQFQAAFNYKETFEQQEGEEREIPVSVFK